ncbi:DnaJ-domain-containing protein [Acephala macrosclerotiorum]|nr:DnaJ-domain-containing protein [Acephala macrosclerotiorum]
MPLRANFFLPTARLHRLFGTNAILRDSKPTHYETLQIPTNATPAEVKKSFYTLSKTHHPDRNPDDPNASQRFVKISEAYAILGTPAKRQAYDHEYLHSYPHSSHDHHHPRGSYHSSGPAGGRPASGLSRRRTQFRGPPPSFYRSGGWGDHSAKRRSAQQSSESSSSGGGMGHGQSPGGYGHWNDVPHFDREGHTRTHENNTRRWARRKGMQDGWVPEAGAPRGTLANFLFVGGIVGVAVLVPALIFERVTNAGRTKKNV